MVVVIFCLFLMPQAASAARVVKTSAPVQAAMLVNMNTGRVLYQRNADRIIQPASLSKIMSLYLICEDIEQKKAALSDWVVISAHAVHTGGSKMLFEPNVRYELLDLMKGMAVHSANDAAVALAEHIAGSEKKFVERMNAKAKELGMKNTHFVNAHGLPDKRQKTTARDIYILSRDYMRRFPNIYKIHSIERFAFQGMMLTNRNDLLGKYPGLDGLKTGYVYASGFHLVATALRGETRLMAIVMGAKSRRSRSEQAKQLLDYGFDFSSTVVCQVAFLSYCNDST